MERQADTLEVAQAGPLVQPPLPERSQGPDRRPGAGPGGAGPSLGAPRAATAKATAQGPALNAICTGGPCAAAASPPPPPPPPRRVGSIPFVRIYGERLQ